MKPQNPLANLLGDLAATGLHVRVAGEDGIAVRPRDRLTPELRSRLIQLKPDVIELLRVHGDELLDLFRRRPA